MKFLSPGDEISVICPQLLMTGQDTARQAMDRRAMDRQAGGGAAIQPAPFTVTIQKSGGASIRSGTPLVPSPAETISVRPPSS